MQDNQNNNQTNWDYTKKNQTEDYSGGNFSQATGISMSEIPPMQWTASEYVAHEKSAGWYGTFFASSVVVVFLVFIITRDILASIVVLLVCSAISIYAGRKPQINSYILSENGVKVQERLYPYSAFKSFSVVEEGAINSIWLKPFKRFAPIVAMYFSPEDEQKIIDILSNFLPHEEHQLDAIDRASKKMRF